MLLSRRLNRGGKILVKINVDKTTPGNIPDRKEIQSRIAKTTKPASDKGAQIIQTRDDLKLKVKTLPMAMGVTEVDDASSVEFDVREVPMIKQRLEIINNYFLRNPVEALSIQANLNSESVASMLG